MNAETSEGAVRISKAAFPTFGTSWAANHQALSRKAKKKHFKTTSEPIRLSWWVVPPGIFDVLTLSPFASRTAETSRRRLEGGSF
jgi:hypothetical protein